MVSYMGVAVNERVLCCAQDAAWQWVSQSSLRKEVERQKREKWQEAVTLSAIDEAVVGNVPKYHCNAATEAWTEALRSASPSQYGNYSTWRIVAFFISPHRCAHRGFSAFPQPPSELHASI
jgi:outer membrane cobalamin receptor